MAKDDDLFSWNRPKPRDADAGALKTLAAQTIQTALQTSNSFRTDVRVIGDTTVKVHTNQGMPWIETFTPRTQHTTPSCPKGDHGFADFFYGEGESNFLGDDPLMGDGPFRKLVDETGARTTPRYMKNNAETKIPLILGLPSLFTGVMRMMMQVMQGVSLEAKAAAKLVHHNQDNGQFAMRVSATFATTHGLFIGEGSSGTVTPWLIEITSGGIWRIPVTFCKRLPSTWRAVLTNTDIEQKHRAKYLTLTNINWAGRVQIADAPEMAEYAQKSGLHANMSWAFNRKGNRAVNCGMGVDPADITGRRRTSTIFTLEITEDADGTPTQATVTTGATDLLMAPFRDDIEGNANAVVQVASSPGHMTTVPLWPGAGNFGSAYGRRTQTPVFAYYDSDDVLDVVYYNFDYTKDTETVVTGNGGAVQTIDVTYPFVDGIGSVTRALVPDDWKTENFTYLPTARFTSKVATPGPQSYNSTSTGGYFALDGSTAQLQENLSAVKYGLGYAAYHRYMATDCFTTETGSRTDIDGPWGQDECWVNIQAYTKNTYTQSESQLNMDVLLIPGYDRTSYIHYTSEDYGLSGRTRTKVDGGISKSTDAVPWYRPNSGGGAEKEPKIMVPGAFNETLAVSQPCLPGNPTMSFTIIHDQSWYCDPMLHAMRLGAGTPTVTGITDSDQSSNTRAIGAVLNGQLVPIEHTTNKEYPKQVTFESPIKYYSCFSGFVPERYAYDTKLDGPSTIAGFSYPSIESRRLAFIGVF
jgi:hypothetical protein